MADRVLVDTSTCLELEIISPMNNFDFRYSMLFDMNNANPGEDSGYIRSYTDAEGNEHSSIIYWSTNPIINYMESMNDQWYNMIETLQQLEVQNYPDDIPDHMIDQFIELIQCEFADDVDSEGEGHVKIWKDHFPNHIHAGISFNEAYDEIIKKYGYDSNTPRDTILTDGKIFNFDQNVHSCVDFGLYKWGRLCILMVVNWA